MKKLLLNAWTNRVASILLGMVFVYAGIMKIGDAISFADSIATFRLLPPELINLLALGLPPLEIALGLTLVAGWQRRLGAFGVFALSLLFLVAVSQGLVRGLEIDCGCFGGGQPSLAKTWMTLSRDLVVSVVSGWLFFWSVHENHGALRTSETAPSWNPALELDSSAQGKI